MQDIFQGVCRMGTDFINSQTTAPEHGFRAPQSTHSVLPLGLVNLTGHHKNMESLWTKRHRAILLHTHHGIHSIGLIDNIEDTGLVDWTSQKSQDLWTGHHRKYKTCGLHTTEDTEHMDWTTQDTGLVDWITKDIDLT